MKTNTQILREYYLIWTETMKKASIEIHTQLHSILACMSNISYFIITYTISAYYIRHMKNENNKSKYQQIDENKYTVCSYISLGHKIYI